MYQVLNQTRTHSALDSGPAECDSRPCWPKSFKNEAETATIILIIRQFQTRHSLADMVIAADAGMLSTPNLRELDEANLRFIVGSRMTKAPADLASHFRWHGDAGS